MTLKSYMDGQFWVIGPRDDRVYMDMSIYKGVGGQTTMQAPPPRPATDSTPGTYVVGDSQLEGMSRFFAKDSRFDKKNISFKRGASYRGLKKLSEKFSIKPGDTLIFASFGGNEATRDYKKRINNILPYLNDLKNSGVKIQIFGPPIGATNDPVRVKKRLAVDNYQKEVLKPFNYVSVWEKSKKLTPNPEEVHYRNEYGRYYEDLIKVKLLLEREPKDKRWLLLRGCWKVRRIRLGLKRK
mgnify:CR=1 FL=1